MKRYKYVLSSAAILILGVLGLHAQISISVSPDPYQTSNYYCVGQSLTCSIQADSNPAKPTASCCNGTNTGTWTLDSYTYFWQYNGDNNFAIHSSLSPSDSAAYTVPSGTFTLTCTISYVWKCSDGSTGYTYPDQKSSPFNSPAHTFPDDSGNAPPQIPAPNNPPAISEPDQSITSIYVGSGAGLIEMYDLYLKGGKFTNIVDTDTYGSPGSSNHTDCGATTTVTWNGASTAISAGFSGSVESVGFSGSLGVNLASTSNSGGPIGADHQRIFYQTYNRNSSITSATNTGSHLWRIWANGETNDLGAANPAFSLPSPPQVTGEILATSSPQACCPDATND